MKAGTTTKLVLPSMNLDGNYQFVLDVYRSNSTFSDTYANEGIRVFVSADGEIDGATEIGFIPREYNVGSSIIPAEMAVGWYTYELPIPMTGTCHIILRGESQYCTATYMDNLVVEVADFCQKPVALKVSNVAKHTATIGWTSEASEWVVAYKTAADEDFTEVTTTQNPYVLTNLAAETTYTVKVRTSCGGGDYSKWSSTVDFTTNIAAPVPTDVSVSNVTTETAAISWNGDATSFNVRYKATSAEEWQTTTATASPLTITGLNDDTEYQVQVQANYGELDGLSGWTDVINFTTDAIFFTPKDVVVNNILSTTADIAWTGNNEATSYNLRYTTDIADGFFEDFENGLSYWTVIRNDEGSEETDWRIEVPDALSASLPSAHSGNSAVLSRSYSGNKGYNVDNWLISPKVNLGNTMTFWMIGDPRYPEHYEVYVSTTTTDIDAFTKVYESDEASKDWTLKTVDLSAYAGQKGYVAFRNIDYDANYLFIDDVTITASPTETVEWTTVNNVTTPYSIEGLTPNTIYTVEVQAVYADGESKWSSTIFKTLDLDAAPFNLQATDVTDNTVTLDWDGVQDSYNVRYRKNSVVYSTLFNSSEDREGWNYNKAIYGVEDTVNNISGDDNYLLEMGWNSTDEQFIISPKLPAYPSGSILEFYHFYYNDENTFQVGYSTTTNETEAFTWSEPIETVSYNDAYTVKFSEVLPDGVKYIALKATAEDQYHCIFIDNLKIYKGGVSDDEWNDVNANTNTLSITELAPNTNYEWQVQGIYNGEPTEWSEVATFTTDVLEIQLANNATDNATLVETNNGKEVNVTLSGRTLYKDGKWNTICLPFDVDLTDENGLLYGADARKVNSASITGDEETGHTLHLSFSEAVTTLEAGVPYIIKWAEGDNITDPVFPNVTISNTYEGFDNGVAGDYRVRFLGTYDEMVYGKDKSVLFMGSSNNLYYPDGKEQVSLSACRAYFKIGENNTVNAKGITGFVIDFGEDGEIATGINEAAADSSLFTPHSSLSEWHTVDGIRLSGKPSKKGMYINNGKKVVVE